MQQLLPSGPPRTHRRSDSSGSIGSSRSASVREDGHRVLSTRANARSQLLERDVARLFTEKVEIFTKLEYTQVCLSETHLDLEFKSLSVCLQVESTIRGKPALTLIPFKQKTVAPILPVTCTYCLRMVH